MTRLHDWDIFECNRTVFLSKAPYVPCLISNTWIRCLSRLSRVLSSSRLASRWAMWNACMFSLRRCGRTPWSLFSVIAVRFVAPYIRVSSMRLSRHFSIIFVSLGSHALRLWVRSYRSLLCGLWANPALSVIRSSAADLIMWWGFTKRVSWSFVCWLSRLTVSWWEIWVGTLR